MKGRGAPGLVALATALVVVGGLGAGCSPMPASDDDGAPGSVAERALPGFAGEASPIMGVPPARPSRPGRISSAAFEMTIPTGWRVGVASDSQSTGWELSRPGHPASTVRVRRFDNVIGASAERSPRLAAEGDRREAAAGRFPGYEPGRIDTAQLDGQRVGHRTATFTVDGRQATGEQWTTGGTAGAYVTLTMVVTEPDDPAAYRELVDHLLDGGLQVR